MADTAITTFLKVLNRIFGKIVIMQFVLKGVCGVRGASRWGFTRIW